MKTRTAFLLRFLLPPLYAATLLALAFVAFEPDRALDFPVMLGALTLYACVFAGLPALLFAFLVGRFARRRPALGGRLVRATLLGLVSGALILAMFAFNSPWLFLPLGTVVGFLVEGTVILLDRRQALAA
jgi:MFS family permease